MNPDQNCWPSRDGLRIGHLNINHVLNKTTDVTTAISNSGKQFHLFGLSESRLTDNIPSSDLLIPDYTIIRRDAKANGEVGLLIYISDATPFKHLFRLDQPGVEAVWLEISIAKSAPILVGFCYRNPASRIDWTDAFTEMMDRVTFETKEIILLGDFNMDLKKQNPRWKHSFDSYNLHQIVKSPTRVTQNSETLIDHIYVSESRNIIETCVPTSNISDHYPVCLTWNKKGAKMPKIGHKTIKYRCFSNFNEQLFLNDISLSPLAMVYNMTEPTEALDFWLDTFNTIYDKHAPYKQKRVKSVPKPKWFTKELQEAIYRRDFLKKHGQHEESKKLRNAINSQKRAAKKKYIQDLLSDKRNSKSTWLAIHQLTNKASLSKPQVNFNISVEQLNDHFSTVAGKIITKNSTGNNTLDKLQQFCQSHNIQDKLEIPLLTVTDVYYALKHLKQSGTRDLDGLDTKILKLAAPLITDTLTYIYNLCITKNTFPCALKKAKVIPIYKSGNSTNPSNYRPISILSVLSKPLEKHINKHLLLHLNRYNLLHPNQSGFRKKHSCQTALTSLVEQWLTNIDNNEFNGVIFVDFKKAFDVIDHDLLLRKLFFYGMSDNALQLLQSYLTSRQQCVIVGTKTSSLSTLKFGVPQGSVLGPILFSLYINDLPLYMEALCELFADDTSLHNHHKNLDTLMNSLQHSVDNLINWTEMNHMALHLDKTKFMLVTTRQKRQNLLPNLPPLTIKSDIIQEVQNHKVLGIIIDNNLSWTPHMNTLCKKISTKVFQLSRLKHFVNFRVRKLFFTSHIQSLIDYRSTLWDSASQNTLKPLHSLHRRALKLILLKQSSLEKDDYNKLNVLPLHTRLKYNKGILMKKIMVGNAPASLSRLFPINPTRDQININIPTPRIDLFNTSLTFSGASLWNSLPYSLKIQSSKLFKKRYLSYLTSLP